jgi:LysM repeat protein
MKAIQIIFFLFFLGSSFVYSQKTIKHTVVEGESIYSIAKKYKVSESDIYELNPKSKGALLQLKTVLLIPNKKNKSKDKKEVASSKNTNSEIHTVESGESLYKIAKKYNITLEKLIELNPDIKPEAIQIGDAIVVLEKKEIAKPKKKKAIEDLKIDVPSPNKDTNLCLEELGNQFHTVQKGETLYQLSKKYKVSVRDLEEMNPEIVANLPIGYEVVIKKGNVELEKNQNIVVEVPKEAGEISFENLSKVEFLIAKASQYLGTRYRGGGTTSAGFDCSGLMFTTFKNIDMTLPRSSCAMAVGAGYRIDRDQAQKGDLIFFTTNGRGSVNHVGMITEINGDEIKFIHSSVQAGVIISSSEEPYYKRRFVQINRVIEN